jgi:hypothetical protein
VNGFYKYLPVMFFVLLFSDRAAVAAYARGIASSGGSTQGRRLQLDEGNRAAEAR